MHAYIERERQRDIVRDRERQTERARASERKKEKERERDRSPNVEEFVCSALGLNKKRLTTSVPVSCGPVQTVKLATTAKAPHPCLRDDLQGVMGLLRL